MKNEPIPAIEKEPAQWQPIEANDEDQKDIQSLRSDDLHLSPGAGLILRRADKAIGYMLFKILNGSEKGHTLFISELQIEKNERSPGLIKKLIGTLRTLAKENEIKELMWGSGNAYMREISDIVADGNGIYTMPIDRLDIKLLSKIAHGRREQKTISIDHV